MGFYEHTINWLRGELFEGKVALVYGIGLVIISFLFWKFGNTPGAKAMLFPLLIVGIMFSGLGASMVINNQKRIVEYPTSYQEDSVEFIKSEKKRTERFMTWYAPARYIEAGIAFLGVGCFLIWPTPTMRALGICLLLIALSAFVVDHFSEERAGIYHDAINREINIDS